VKAEKWLRAEELSPWEYLHVNLTNNLVVHCHNLKNVARIKLGNKGEVMTPS
jgi:hypothetical protein